jgi:hypothetical protein
VLHLGLLTREEFKNSRTQEPKEPSNPNFLKEAKAGAFAYVFLNLDFLTWIAFQQVWRKKRPKSLFFVPK